jgi:hypothetical protein
LWIGRVWRGGRTRRSRFCKGCAAGRWRKGSLLSVEEEIVVDDIKKAVHTAAGSSQKIAMFHFQVLKHAKELEGINAKAFARKSAFQRPTGQNLQR